MRGRGDGDATRVNAKPAPMMSAGPRATQHAEVTELAMRVCGGAAFRKDLGLERHFRDARASTVMSPTTDVLYDFIGKAVAGLPLF